MDFKCVFYPCVHHETSDQRFEFSAKFILPMLLFLTEVCEYKSNIHVTLEVKLYVE